MSDTTTVVGRPSTECRAGNHKNCARLQMRCECNCHRKGPQVPPTTSTTLDGMSGYCRASAHTKCLDAGMKGPGGQGRCDCPCHRRNGSSERAPSKIQTSPTAVADKAKPDRPAFRLIKKDPPRKLGLADHLIPLLAQIPDDDTAWWSIAECPTPRGATVMATQCKKIGIPGWRWRAGDGEVFVRRERDGADTAGEGSA